MSRRRNPYPGVSKVIDRHGKVRWRFRTKGRSQYLPGPYGSADFVAAYEEAKNGAAAPLRTPTEPHGSVSWVIRGIWGQIASKGCQRAAGGRCALRWTGSAS